MESGTATPGGQHEIPEELRQRAATNIDPAVVGILKRAVQLAMRDGVPTVTVKEVLESFLHATVTPSLIHHLQDARSIYEDEHDGASRVMVNDESVLAAQLDDRTSSVYQVLEQRVADMDELRALVARRVVATPPDDRG